jgi:hypothetical protein
MDESARCETTLVCEQCSKAFEKGRLPIQMLAFGINANFIKNQLTDDTVITVGLAKLLFEKVENDHANLA